MSILNSEEKTKNQNQLQVDYKRGPLKLTQINFLKDVKVYTMQMVKIKMIRKWYSTKKLTSKKRATQKALNMIKQMTIIAKSCNPIRRCNTQTSLHLTTKLNIHKYVYICVCALKSDENTRRN